MAFARTLVRAAKSVQVSTRSALKSNTAPLRASQFGARCLSGGGAEESSSALPMIGFSVAVVGGAAAVYFMGAPPLDAPEEVQNDPVGYFTRTGAAVSNLVDDQMSDNKNTEKLLPPPLPPMYRLNDRTLVLDWDKTLVYTNWTIEKGARTIKRPGLDYFLKWASQHFGEVVLYSEKDAMEMVPMMDKVDPQTFENREPVPRMFTYYLFKHQLSEGEDDKPVKKLERLNRDMKNIILVDDDPVMFRENKENAIQIPAFEGDPEDVALMDLIPFLTAIINTPQSDVRDVCRSYQGIENVGKNFTDRLKEKRGDGDTYAQVGESDKLVQAFSDQASDGRSNAPSVPGQTNIAAGGGVAVTVPVDAPAAESWSVWGIKIY